MRWGSARYPLIAPTNALKPQYIAPLAESSSSMAFKLAPVAAFWLWVPEKWQMMIKYYNSLYYVLCRSLSARMKQADTAVKTLNLFDKFRELGGKRCSRECVAR